MTFQVGVSGFLLFRARMNLQKEFRHHLERRIEGHAGIVRQHAYKLYVMLIRFVFLLGWRFERCKEADVTVRQAEGAMGLL